MSGDEPDAEAMLSSSVNMTHMDEIDTEVRDHFQFLRQSIGQNFASVLNDPREEKAGWFGGGLFGDKQPENPVRLSKIPTVSPQPITDYIAALGPSYKAWRAAKRAKEHSGKPADLGMLTVPPKFFGQSFDVLMEPSFFEGIMPEVQDPYTSQLLVSKLEFFQSEVDAKLFAQVKQRSPQFFEALKQFNTLKAQVGVGLEHISSLRTVVTTTQAESATPSLKIIQLKRRLRNQKRTLELLKAVQQLQTSRAAVQEKIQSGDHSTSIADIGAATENVNAFSLQRLACTQGALSEFTGVKEESFKVIQKALLELLLGSQRMWPDSNEDTGEEEWVAKARASVAPLIAQGLGPIREVLLRYRKGVLDEAKSIVVQTISRSMRIILEDPSLPSEELLKPTRLRGLSVVHFSFALEQLFQAVFFCFRKTCRITSSLAGIISKSRASGFDQKVLTDLLNEARSSVVRIIRSRIIRMFEIREEEHASLRFSEIYQVMSLAFKFILNLESISRDTDSSLKATLITQARNFFKKQHEKQQQKLLEILLSERWEAENEIDVSFQAYCDRMTDESPESIAAAKSMAIDKKNSVPVQNDVLGEGCNPRLSLCGQAYYSVSHSVLMLLRILADYEQYVFAMPFLAHDVAQRAHDLLKVYDGQTAGLILGAGARETAGIGTITVSHLAVSAQCLSFLADFAPRFRRRLEAVLPERSTVFLKNLDRFSKEAIDHRNEFYVKVVLMVKEGLKEWKPENWRKEGGAWVLSLLKEVGRLLKKGGLERLLEKRQLRIVIYPILYSYYVKIKTCISGIKDLQSDPALLTKVKEDILHYKVNIENFGFSVLLSTKARDLTNASTWLPPTDESLPEPDDEVLALFLP